MFLEDMYAFTEFTTNSSELGWPGSRKRKYVILMHRNKCNPVPRFNITDLAEALARERLVSWKSTFVADEEEEKEQLRLAIERKTMREKPWAATATRTAKGTNRRVSSQHKRGHVLAAQEAFDYSKDDAFESLLPSWETKTLPVYRKMYPKRAWSLNQNPNCQLLSPAPLHSICPSHDVC